MAANEILVIAVGSGLLAVYGPKVDLLVIVSVVLLARIRGRVREQHGSPGLFIWI
jgi:hypothetical protein